MRLTPIASATCSTARRNVNAPRSSSRRTARCLSSRSRSGSRPPSSASTTVDQAVERTVQRRHPHDGEDLTVPDEGYVAGLAVLGRDDRRADRIHDRLDGDEQGVGHHAGSRSVSLTTCMETCVAPLAKAARVMAARMSGIDAESARHVDPNGPNSTSAAGGPCGVDGCRHVRAGPTLDERLDHELQLLHGGERTGGQRRRRRSAHRRSSQTVHRHLEQCGAAPLVRSDPGSTRPRHRRGRWATCGSMSARIVPSSCASVTSAAPASWSRSHAAPSAVCAGRPHRRSTRRVRDTSGCGG